MKRRYAYRLALLMLGAAFITGCAAGKGADEEAAEAVQTEVATVAMENVLPQAGEAKSDAVEESKETATAENEAEKTKEETATETTESYKTTEDETVGIEVAETKKNNKKATKGTITVATIGSPNTEILQQAALLLEEEGYALKVEVCEDYLTPNQMVVDGTVDCNYYQHEAFLERYNIEHQTALAEVEKIHYEPLAIYSKTVDDLQQVQKGMKVAISDNPTAIARALWMLQDVELITLMSDADMNTVKDDVEKNPYELEFVFVDESTLAAKLEEADLVMCTKNLLLQEAIDEEEILLAVEGQDTMMAQKLAQSLVASNAANEKAQILAEVLMRDEIKQFIDTKYQGSVLVMEASEETLEETENTKETDTKK